MGPQSYGSLVSSIGVSVQVGATTLLLALFYLLTRHAGTRPYFIRWAWAWFALVPALLLVVLRYLVASAGSPDATPPPSALLSLLHTGYLLGKLLHLGLLMSGVWLFARGVLPPIRPLPWLLGSLALAALGGIGAPDLFRSMLLQAPIAVGCYGLGARLLAGLPPARRTMGTRFTAIAFGWQAALWAVYWVSSMDTLLKLQLPIGWLAALTAMNSYLDSVTSALLAFGMVVILLEDTRRDAEDARAEQLRAVEESEARLKAVMETATDGIVAADGDGRLVFVNGGAARLLGQRRAGMIGHAMAEYFTETSQAALERRMLEMRRMTPGRQALFEVTARDVSGREIPLEISASTLARAGTVLEIFVLRDLTDRRQAEADREQLQSRLAQSVRMEALGRLVSGVAHELNNPLAAILTFSEQLLSEQPTGEIAGPVGTIREQARRARAIVRDLLTFVRRREERRESAEIGLLVERTVRALDADLARQSVTLSVTIEPGLPALHCDPTGIEQVLTNLLDNAARAAVRGRVSLVIHREGDGLAIEVEDSGPGIPQDHLPRIFEPFFTTRGMGEGTGLGLSVSLGIVQQHGGLLRAANREPGPGARFVAWLPFGTPADAIAVATRTSGPVAAVRDGVSAGRVLIIDDEAAIRTSIRRYFERQKWVVEEASDGAVGLAKLLATQDKETYDLVICDLRMPGLTGLELHHWLSLSRPDLLGRLVFVSGDTASPETAAFLGSSNCAVLEKPFELRELAAIVTRICGPR